ncbi:hypothetical protein, variant [Sphaeroforma arctica JP610]|uniref:BZIP domain-containing protein n=1 Tax=Sphaeroforma arctica JP610 TaxID=667725 RepID=A0A0L0G5V3_9EUKA|nr:hypothetical protein, variant [Sphaeroforma arctica JP610]KNC83593.1 hypothetical protein, variant [Sphaeroforma arctica JP610]|eukprot:XP_014157495.1 hypothetical protein, variant [Sphaeroforma arctica JP610]
MKRSSEDRESPEDFIFNLNQTTSAGELGEDGKPETAVDRRKRNCIASARFRQKKKQEMQMLEEIASNKTEECEKLQQTVKLLQAELQYFKQLLCAEAFQSQAAAHGLQVPGAYNQASGQGMSMSGYPAGFGMGPKAMGANPLGFNGAVPLIKSNMQASSLMSGPMNGTKSTNGVGSSSTNPATGMGSSAQSPLNGSNKANNGISGNNQMNDSQQQLQQQMSRPAYSRTNSRKEGRHSAGPSPQLATVSLTAALGHKQSHSLSGVKHPKKELELPSSTGHLLSQYPGVTDLNSPGPSSYKSPSSGANGLVTRPSSGINGNGPNNSLQGGASAGNGNTPGTYTPQGASLSSQTSAPHSGMSGSGPQGSQMPVFLQNMYPPNMLMGMFGMQSGVMPQITPEMAQMAAYMAMVQQQQQQMQQMQQQQQQQMHQPIQKLPPSSSELAGMSDLNFSLKSE